MNVYKIIPGDTFESIARKQYGTEQEAGRIARANSGIVEPLTPGSSLVVPVIPDAPKDLQQQAVATNENETAILIDGERFRFWDSVRITRSMDVMGTIEFGAPFDSSIPNFRKIFRPLSYKESVVTVGGEPLFTGTVMNASPVIENGKKIISITGYSLPGALNDCTPPASLSQLDKLQFEGQGLREIVKTLVSPFGIDVDFQADQGAIFKRPVALEPDKKILSFLIDLAKQRNLVISSTSLGKLLIWRSVSVGEPVAHLEQGASPVLSITPMFNPQGYYSDITGLDPASIDSDGSQFTVKNPHLKGIVRPFTFKATDTNDSNIKLATQAKAGRMFANMVAYSVSVDTWHNPFGKLWEPNTTITLLAPDAMIYNKYEFIIRSITFERDRTTETAILNLVLPGSFSGEISETLPWD